MLSRPKDTMSLGRATYLDLFEIRAHLCISRMHGDYPSVARANVGSATAEFHKRYSPSTRFEALGSRPSVPVGPERGPELVPASACPVAVVAGR
jgi:hypothetical protein